MAIHSLSSQWQALFVLLSLGVYPTAAETPESTECSSTTATFAIVGAALAVFGGLIFTSPVLLICLWKKRLNKKRRPG